MRSPNADVSSRLLEAVRYLSEGHIGVAEAHARTILDSVPDHAAAWNLLGVIAARIGCSDLAAEYFMQALKSEPGLVQAKENLATVRCAPMRPALPDTERFLIIEAWGSGFWSDVCHALGCLLLAEITGRIPVTHWGANSLFAAGTSDAFRLYFEPVSGVTLEDVRAIEGARYFPPPWSQAHWPVPGPTKAAKSGLPGLYFLNRPETVAVSDSYVSVFQLLPWIPKSHPLHGEPIDAVYRALVAKYLRPAGTVFDDVERFYRDKIAGRPTIAVHVRGSDKWSEMRHAFHGAQRYFDILDREDSASCIFLLTDDLRVLARFRNRYGERVIATECQRTSADLGLHLQHATDHVRAGREVMVDVFLALRCDKFFGMGWSNVSAIIAMLKPWSGQCFLLGPGILMDRFV